MNLGKIGRDDVVKGPNASKKIAFYQFIHMTGKMASHTIQALKVIEFETTPVSSSHVVTRFLPLKVYLSNRVLSLIRNYNKDDL